jgi:glucokinase
MILLAGDIGGTKTSLAIYTTEAGPRAPLAEATFPSAEYPSLESLVREFLSQVDLEVERASFGVAGPVVGGQAKVTNLPWIIEEAQLEDALTLSPVRLLNDLQAIANGVPFLEPADLHTLNEGQPGHRRHRAGHRAGGGVPHLGWNPLPTPAFRGRPHGFRADHPA